MSHAVAVLATIILSALVLSGLDLEVKKDYAKAGYMIIDKRAYRLVPVDPQ
jgi:hypothetical protein